VFITPAESALAAAAFVSAGSAGVAAFNRRGGREQRVWERKCEVYEDSLKYVAGWAEYRRERDYHNDPEAELPIPKPRRDAYLPLVIRLAMFGSRSVQDAFHHCLVRELEWSGLQVALSGLREDRDAVTRGMRAPGTGPDGGEVDRVRARDKEIFEVADHANESLTNLISGEVNLRRRRLLTLLRTKLRRGRESPAG
jgi:hypothetical protein